jgi:enterochelin esterase-like enzyme
VFIQFIEDELLPELVARYGVTQAREGRCLYGHSNGGFAALWAALERPELFAGVVAASPNLSTADGLIFDLLDTRAPNAEPTTLRTAVGSLETPASITAPHALLTQRLAEEAPAGLQHDARVFGGLSHSRVVGPAYRWAIADCIGGTP